MTDDGTHMDDTTDDRACAADSTPTNSPTQPSEQATDADESGVSAVRALADTEDEFTRKLISAIKTVYDPEIPVDIFELGLIYKIDVDDAKNVAVEMTLTAPGCPIAAEMPLMVEEALKTVEGVGTIKVDMTFDPPWTLDNMSEEARVALDMF